MEDQDATGVVLSWLVGVVNGVDGEPGEDGVVELAALIVASPPVQVVGTVEERQDVLETLLDGAGVEVGLGEQPGGVGDVGTDLVLPVAEVFDGDGSGEVSVEELLLGGLQAGQAQPLVGAEGIGVGALLADLSASGLRDEAVGARV